MELLKVIVKRLQALEDAYREHAGDVQRLDSRVTAAEVTAARVASSVIDRGVYRPDSLDGRLRAIELAIASVDARLGVMERKHETLRQDVLAHQQQPRPSTAPDARIEDLLVRLAALESRPEPATDVPVAAAPGLRIVGAEEKAAKGVLYLK